MLTSMLVRNELDCMHAVLITVINCCCCRRRRSAAAAAATAACPGVRGVLRKLLAAKPTAKPASAKTPKIDCKAVKDANKFPHGPTGGRGELSCCSHYSEGLLLNCDV